MKVYDLLWKKAEDEKTGKARWQKVGVLIEKDEGMMSVKIDLGFTEGQLRFFVTISSRSKTVRRRPLDNLLIFKDNLAVPTGVEPVF